MNEAKARDLAGGKAADLLAIVADCPGTGGHEARNRAQKGGFARAVRPDHSHDLALGDLDADTVEHVEQTVTGDERLDRQLHLGPRVDVRGRPRIVLEMMLR